MKESELVLPGNPYFEKLAGYQKRHLSLSEVPVVLIGDQKNCSWCGVKPIIAPRRKYCSDECGDSIYIHFNPNCNTALVMLLERQEYKCNCCGHDYKEALEEAQYKLIEEHEEHIKLCESRSWTVPPPYPYQLDDFCNQRSVALLRGLKVGTSIEVDHIIAIAAGGDPFGLDNVQAICSNCHKKKTSVDREEIKSFKQKLKEALIQ